MAKKQAPACAPRVKRTPGGASTTGRLCQAGLMVRWATVCCTWREVDRSNVALDWLASAARRSAKSSIMVYFVKAERGPGVVDYDIAVPRRPLNATVQVRRFLRAWATQLWPPYSSPVVSLVSLPLRCAFLILLVNAL